MGFSGAFVSLHLYSDMSPKVFSALGVALPLTDARKDANKLGGRAFLWTVTNIRYYK
jgi:hypothetical protein